VLSISSTLLRLQIPNAKKTVKPSVFFALLGSAHIKAAFRTLMKLTPGCSQFHQHFTCNSYIQKCFVKPSLFTVWLCIFWRKKFGAKAARKILKKLTIGVVNFTHILPR